MFWTPRRLSVMAALPESFPFVILGATPAGSRATGATHPDDKRAPSGGNDLVKMPKMLYGTAWKKERTRELCLMALREGFRGFDTACQPKHYNQRGLGEAIKEGCTHMNLERKDLFIQTKYTPVEGQDPHNIPYDPKLPIREQVLSSIKVSLEELGVSYIDAALLHSPLGTFEDTLEAWRGLEAAMDEGHVRALGISNCYSLETLQRLHQAARAKPVLIQNRFYPATRYDSGMRRWCRTNGITYQGFWTLTANPHILCDPLITESAERLKCTPEQLWFRYLIERDIVPLTGTSSVEHMKNDIDCVNIRLPCTVCEQLDASLPIS